MTNFPIFHYSIFYLRLHRAVSSAVSFFVYLYSIFCQHGTDSESDLIPLRKHSKSALHPNRKLLPSPQLKHLAPKFPYCTVLHHRHFIDDALFKRAAAMFGETGVIDLVGVSGYYTLVSMVLNVAEVPLPPGEKSPW